MEIRQFRNRMYNWLMPSRKIYTSEFLNEVKEFVAFACQQVHLAKGKIRWNMNYIMLDEVSVHLYKKGFVVDY